MLQFHSGASEAGEASDSLPRTVPVSKGTLWRTPASPRGGDSPFPHDVAIERVEDALVGQLQGVIQDFHVLAALHFRGISCLHRCRELLLPHLQGTGSVRMIPHVTTGGTQLAAPRSQQSVTTLEQQLCQRAVARAEHFLFLLQQRRWPEPLCHAAGGTCSTDRNSDSDSQNATSAGSAARPHHLCRATCAQAGTEYTAGSNRRWLAKEQNRLSASSCSAAENAPGSNHKANCSLINSARGRVPGAPRCLQHHPRITRPGLFSHNPQPAEN